jgi:predicted ArsR family transcriptional regulator
MRATGWEQRFLDGTRGRVLALLRRARLTVDELAERLGLTDNAVRAHLAALERDGLVRQGEVRRGGVGKPAHTYEIAPAAETLFSRAYIPFVRTLLAELATRAEAGELEDVMRAVGRRLAVAAPRTRNGGKGGSSKGVRERAAVAAALLEELGGAVAIGEEAGRVVIRGAGCPLGEVTRERAEVCAAVQSMIEEIVGEPVAECCTRGERPRCHFQIVA